MSFDYRPCYSIRIYEKLPFVLVSDERRSQDGNNELRQKVNTL